MPRRPQSSVSLKRSAKRTPVARPRGARQAVSQDAQNAQDPRAERVKQRREAILAAALEEFSQNGFAAARLDDIAQRAGIAKGTIYLYFRDKETLFQELLRVMFTPIVSALERASKQEGPVRDVVERMIDLFIREVVNTKRRDVIRLIIAEGARFPKLAEFHYREVVSRALVAIRDLMARAVKQGEIRNPHYARFPQLLVAPGLIAAIWSGLFERFAPLDAKALMRAHLDNVFGERKAP